MLENLSGECCALAFGSNAATCAGLLKFDEAAALQLVGEIAA